MSVVIQRMTATWRTHRLRIVALLVLLSIGAALAVLWSKTPLGTYADLDELAHLTERLQDMPLAPLIVLAVYAIGGFVLLPIPLTVAATGLVFGIWPGLFYAAVGTLLSASLTYGVGAAIGHDRLTRIAGDRVAGLSERAGRHGIKSVVGLRLVPLAPFGLMNAILGASHIRFRDYLLGTCLGMGPGLVVKVVFADQIADAARASDETSLGFLAVGAIVLIALGVVIRKRFFSPT